MPPSPISDGSGGTSQGAPCRACTPEAVVPEPGIQGRGYNSKATGGAASAIPWTMWRAWRSPSPATLAEFVPSGGSNPDPQLSSSAPLVPGLTATGGAIVTVVVLRISSLPHVLGPPGWHPHPQDPGGLVSEPKTF